MTIRLAEYGNTDWSDGEVLNATDLNDTFSASIMRASTSAEDTTEYGAVVSTSATDLGYSKTFTCPAGTNNKLFGIKVVLDRKITANTGYLRLKLTNNTTGAIVYVYNEVSGSSPKKVSFGTGFTNTTYATVTSYSDLFRLDENSEAWMSSSSSLSSGLYYASQNFSTIGLGSSYTITIEGFTNSGGPTINIQNITLTFYWTTIMDEVTEGWA